MAIPANKVALPHGVRCGHVEHRLTLPAPYAMRCLIGQLVDVRDPAGNRYLLSEDETHFHLHRRVVPGAPGHERNRTESTPALSIPKEAAGDGK